jgi:hypothetical protein
MLRRLAILLTCLLAAAAAMEGHAGGPSAQVQLSVSGALEGPMLHVRGSATVPDGTWISYAVYRPGDVAQRATGVARVENQRFDARVDVARWPAGKIVVDAHFQILVPGRTQPEAVIARYGPRGEHMTGPDVVQGGASYRAAVAAAMLFKP